MLGNFFNPRFRVLDSCMRTLSILALFAPVSCASIVAPATDQLRVYAAPKAAEVSLDGETLGSAPMTLDIPKHGRSSVEVSAPGYRRAICRTEMTANGGYVAADVALCVLFFPIGCISFIDAGGAWNELDRPTCNVTLSPERP
jgi:hypothetical protein